VKEEGREGREAGREWNTSQQRGGGSYPLLAGRGLHVGSVSVRAYIHDIMAGVQQRNPYYPRRRTPRGRALKREFKCEGGR